jgi:uncharacterized membrane protein (UPF0182 family)
VAMRPPLPSLTLSRRSKIALSVMGILIVLIIALVKLTGVYVNWLWFRDVGYRSVYSHVLWTRVALFAIFGVGMALALGVNLAVAYRIRPPFRPMSTEQQNLEHYRVMIEPRRKLILGLVMVLSLFASGMSAQGDWKVWQLWLHGGTFGVKDPQFHRDISFWTWDYPAYRLMLNFGFSAIIFSLLLSIAVHYLSGAIRLQTPGPKITISARRHLTILVFIFMALKAVAYWLDRYGLVFSSRSKFTGASYTDVHSSLPAKTILFWVAILIAIGVLASLWMRSPLIPAIGFVSMLVLSILISGIYPAIVQQVSVKPNASSKEVPYIKRNITATRDAYGVQTGTDVTYVPYNASSSPPTSALTTSNPTIGNVRILDPNVISATFSRFQQDGNVYGFPDKLDVDRYTLPDPTGKDVTHDYVVAVRELDKANLTGNQTNWINQHTNYTHGYGFVAAEADTDVTNDGNNSDAFAAGGIPPTGELRPTHPEVYYGELLPDYSIVGAAGTPQEFNGNGSAKITYKGGGGVSLGNIFTRLAFAVKYKQGNFVLNDAASAKGAKIIFNRDPRQMVQKVAPFLTVDSDPYPIIDTATGDIVWMVDAYTTLNNYPYSERQSLSSLTNDSLSATDKTASQPNDSINYIRNSVKATVDAYTGKVTLYQWDNKDPVLKAWMSIFPGIVQPGSMGSQMPEAIRSHVRYPEDLFEVQRAMLAQYHVDNPVTFYNVGDKWTVPNDPTTTAGVPTAHQPPYYVLAAPADGSSNQPVFQLTSPMNVNNSTYLASFVSVDNDPGPDYGKITVLQLPPHSSSVQGPEQVFSKISGNATITKDLSLFNTAGGGSTVIHGNLLTLPIGNSFLYVEPLYTRSTGGGSGSYPQLQRIIVVYGDKVGYGETLTQALSDFLPNHSTGQTLPTPGSPNTSNPIPTPTPTSTPTSPPTGKSTTPAPASQQVLLTQLDTAFGDLLAASKSGDLGQIGAAQTRVNELLQQYLTKYGPLPSTAPTPGKPTPSPSK